MDAVCCAQCCGIFSISGIVFLLLIAILLDNQPLYIKDIDDSSEAATNCYVAAALYAGMVVVCYGYLHIHNKKKAEMTTDLDEGQGNEALSLTKDRFGNMGYGSREPTMGVSMAEYPR